MELVLPFKRNNWRVRTLGLYLFGWVVIVCLVLSKRPCKADSWHVDPFVGTVMVVLGLAVLWAFLAFLWNLLAKEVIQAEPFSLAVTRKFLGWKKARRYDLRLAGPLALVPQDPHEFMVSSWGFSGSGFSMNRGVRLDRLGEYCRSLAPFWGVAGTITFEYCGKMEKFGCWLSTGEASWVLSQVEKFRTSQPPGPGPSASHVP